MARKTAGIIKRKDGRFESRFTIGGVRYHVYGDTIAQTREKEAEKRQEIAEGGNLSGGKVPFKKYASQWLEAKRDTVKETTMRTNRILINAACGAKVRGGVLFGDLKLKDIQTADIRELQRELTTAHSTRTTNDTIHTVKAILAAAVNERVLQWNAAAGVKALRRTEEQARDTVHRALTMDETRAFLKAAEGDYYYPLFVFLLNTGLRIGEAGALLPKDFSGSGDSVEVRRTITRCENGGYKIGQDTKTAAGRRFVPLNAAARGAVKQQRETRAALDGESVLQFNKPLFVSPRGTLLKASCINAAICRICDRAGVERFTVHAMRDSFATRCAESGMQPKTLQSIMGHSDISMTMNLYAHCMDETKTAQLLTVNFQ